MTSKKSKNDSASDEIDESSKERDAFDYAIKKTMASFGFVEVNADSDESDDLSDTPTDYVASRLKTFMSEFRELKEKFSNKEISEQEYQNRRKELFERHKTPQIN